MNEPLTLLMSTRAAEAFGADVARILGARPHRILTPGAAPDAQGEYPVDIAFMTREVTADSGKLDLAPSLERFYAVLRASPKLQWYQTHSAGSDRPIYGEMLRRGVVVTTASGATSVPVAQLAVTGLLALSRRLPDLLDSQRRKAWEPLLGPRQPQDLKGQTVAIVGTGPIGQEVARVCGALRMDVVGVRRSAEPLAGFDRMVAFDDFEALLPQADWVVLACPLTDTTCGLLDARRLALLPAGARIVNVARGEVVVEADLVDALRSGQVGGAFLDVFEREPLAADSPLWTLPNVIVSPHTAGHTTGLFDAVGEIFIDNLQRWRDGAALRNRVQS